MSLYNLCRMLNVNERAVLARVRITGESLKASLLYYMNQPRRGYEYKAEIKGNLTDLREWCNRYKVKYQSLVNYYHRFPDIDIYELIDLYISKGLIVENSLNVKELNVRDYCKQLNYDYKLVVKYKNSRPDKSYTEVLKEWENLSQDEILNNIRLYDIWCDMIGRCYNPKNPTYKYYGGKKINPTQVCDKWQDYLGFKQDNWEEYINHIKQYGKEQTSIDRNNWDGNYEPSNCEWADWEQQGRNKSTTKYLLPCNNYQRTLSWHCKQNGYNYNTIKEYIKKYNLTPDKALAKYLSKRKNK